MDLPRDVALDLQKLNDLFRSQRTLSTKLEAVAEIIQRIVPGCDSVSVTLAVEEAMFTGATTSQLAIEADLVQYSGDEGPCIDSAREHAVVRIDALSYDERYEHFAPGAVEMGIESVLSLPLAGDHPVGSINLYSRQREAFSDEVPEQVGELVDHASHLVASSPLYEASVDVLVRVVEAVRQATQVEMAVGMLIVTQGLGPAEAWNHLRDRAADEGVTIYTCAEDLIAAHERSLEDVDEDPPA